MSILQCVLQQNKITKRVLKSTRAEESTEVQKYSSIEVKKYRSREIEKYSNMEVQKNRMYREYRREHVEK